VVWNIAEIGWRRNGWERCKMDIRRIKFEVGMGNCSPATGGKC